MILGRPTNLILAAFTALFNVFVILKPDTFTGVAVAAINVAAASLIALIANQPPTVSVGATVNVRSANGTPDTKKTV